MVFKSKSTKGSSIQTSCLPILFNVCLYPLFCSLERDGLVWTLKDASVTALPYADNTAMISDSREGLKKNLALVKTYCDRAGQRVNVKKSYVFHIRSIGKIFTVNYRYCRVLILFIL